MSLSSRLDGDVGIETIFGRTFENLLQLWRQLLIYCLGVVAIALAGPFLGGGPGGLATFWIGWGLYFAGQYWLYRELMALRGLLETSEISFFGFCGLAVVLIVPIMVGVTFFLLPGIFLVGRWIAAPAFIVSRGESIFVAAGHSWQISRGKSLKLAVTLAVLFILWLVLVALFGGLDISLEGFSSFDGRSPVEAFEFHILPILLLGMSVTTYELLGRDDLALDKVFA